LNKRTVIPFFADMHSGHVLGLIPDEPWQLEEGTYLPGYTQKIAYEKYMDVCTQVAIERKKSRLIAVYNGDMADGIHHDNRSIWATTEEEQERCAIDCIDKGRYRMKYEPKGGDLSLFISGTEAHAGRGFQSEERIASDLGGIPYKKPTKRSKKDGRYLWPWRNFLVNGVRFDVSHHGVGVGRRAWTEENTMRSALTSRYLEAKVAGEPVPKEWWFIWAHHHRYLHVTLHRSDCTFHGVTLPAYQGITHFGNKVMPTNKLADIGSVWITVEPNGETTFHKDFIRFTPQKAEEI
jgi:hypothetical protein